MTPELSGRDLLLLRLSNGSGIHSERSNQIHINGTSMMFRYYKFSFTYLAYLLIGIILFYLIFGTGLHGDDYSVIKSQSMSNFLLLTPTNLGLKIFGIPDYLIFWWVYSVLGYEYQWAYDLIKWLAHMASVYMVWRFFSVFISLRRALAAAVIFVLLPLHETTTYWYMTAPYVFWPSVTMFSFYLFSANEIKTGFIVGLLGAFSWYLSSPYVFGLGVIWFVRKEYRKGMLFIIPGLLYVIYYFSIKIAFPLVEKRINHELDLLMFFNGMVMQVAGTMDSFVGPSAFIKLYYSALSIDLLSLLITIGILVAAWRHVGQRHNEVKVKCDSGGLNDLLIGAISVLVLSLVMFSLTGLYVPTPFNLANRSLVYGSLFAAVLLASLPINRKTLLILWLIFVLPVFGLSDHWKAWNQEQLHILHNISSHDGLATLKETDMLVVTGHIYNKLGPYSYIEFFSMPWVVSSIFRDFASVEHVVAITQTVTLEGEKLIDNKFGGHYPLTGNVYIYDSERNVLHSGTHDDIEMLIKDRPQEIRHWVQLANGTFIEALVLNFSQRLSYLFSRDDVVQ